MIDRQPPGYLDAEKGDEHPEGAAGDFLVYWQACEEAARRGLDLIIVTNDEKEDWWWRHKSAFIGPRQEMTKEYFDLSNGRRLHLLRTSELLARSAALNVEVSPDSVEDAERDQDEFPPLGEWTVEAVTELLRSLDAAHPTLADVIREAAAQGGTISIEAVDELRGDDRDPRFTQPIPWLTADLQVRGLLPDLVMPALAPMHADGGHAISGYRVPPDIVAALRGSRGSKYRPLTDWLLKQRVESVPVTFAELEEVLGFPLAPSARNHQPYWYSTHNSLGKAIAAGGFKARALNLAAETVTLTRR